MPSLRLFLPVLLCAACTRTPPPPGAPPPTVALKDVRVVRTEGSQVALRGELAELSFRRSAGTYDGRDARFRVTGNGQTGSYEVAAPSVTGTPSEQRARGEGGVRLRTDRGVNAQSPSATLDGNGGVVTGTEHLSARGPGFAVEGDSFRLSMAGETHQLSGRVTTTLEAQR